MLRSLNDLPFIKINGSCWIECERLSTFLQNSRGENEPNVNYSNILRDLRSYKAGNSEFKWKKIVSASSVLKYLIKLSDKYSVCETVLSELTDIVFNFQQKENRNIFNVVDLYKEIAKYDLWCEDLLLNVNIKHSYTLYTDYKSHFNELEWKKICYFEYHFGRGRKTILQYEEELQEKCVFLQSLKISKNTAEVSQQKCEQTIQTNNLRKSAADAIHGQNCVHNDVTHSYIQLDKTLNACLEQYLSGKGKCVCISCNNSCVHQGDIHVVVELKTCSNETFSEIANLLSIELQGKHNLKSTTFVFVKDGTLDSYKCKYCDEGNSHRFQLQRDLNSKTQEFVIGGATVTELQYNDPELLQEVPHLQMCAECFSSICYHSADALDWRSFDVVTEWLHHVPIEIQLFFSTWFVNKRSIKKSRTPSEYLQTKTTKLYALFDAGLSLLNRNYHGVIQQLNSEDLLINYHSLTTVFDITSSFGCTYSLKTAERWLKMASDPNVSHFETFINRYPLTYQTHFETKARTHNVSLQDCYLVFFMDNLVRLTTHEDPDPGMNRTSQVCTLPLTFKGLPRNNIVTESWHSETCEDLSSECKCMDSIHLSKDDYKLLVECSPAESLAWQMFSCQLTWGLVKRSSTDGVLPQFLSEGKHTKEMEEEDEMMIIADESTSNCKGTPKSLEARKGKGLHTSHPNIHDVREG